LESDSGQVYLYERANGKAETLKSEMTLEAVLKVSESPEGAKFDSL
jgi:hypothetical protein